MAVRRQHAYFEDSRLYSQAAELSAQLPAQPTMSDWEALERIRLDPSFSGTWILPAGLGRPVVTGSGIFIGTVGLGLHLPECKRRRQAVRNGAEQAPFAWPFPLRDTSRPARLPAP